MFLLSFHIWNLFFKQKLASWVILVTTVGHYLRDKKQLLEITYLCYLIDSTDSASSLWKYFTSSRSNFSPVAIKHHLINSMSINCFSCLVRTYFGFSFNFPFLLFKFLWHCGMMRCCALNLLIFLFPIT